MYLDGILFVGFGLSTTILKYKKENPLIKKKTDRRTNGKNKTKSEFLKNSLKKYRKLLLKVPWSYTWVCQIKDHGTVSM
jgi:hypothetical protein